MKKILLVLGLVSVPFFGQVVSLEASEGYSVGDIHGQQGWTTTGVGQGNIKNQTVSNEQASDGTQSLKITKEEAYGTQNSAIVGAFYGVTPVIPVAEFKMSFDVFFNAIGPNVYGFNPTNIGAQKYVAVVYVSDAGEVQMYKSQNLVGTGVKLQAQKWYTISYKTTSEGLDVYVDGQKVGTSDLLNNGNVDQVRFMNNNAGGSAYIDNIRLGSDATFAVGDIASNNELKVYPNPVKDFLSIDVPSTEKVKSVSIFSVDGRSSVLSFDNNKADFSNLPAGVYVLQVETDSQTYTKKVIKK